jgi:hydrogenase maturation protein HypF
MLPYMPFHFQLFNQIQLQALVMTSGNISDEPILIDDNEALSKLGPHTDGVLSYNRGIANRCDDSVVIVVNEKPRLIRRSRGYVPSPIHLPFAVEGILATGAELKNTFALGKGEQCILSQHVGDLKNMETYNFYTETIARFSRLFRFTPTVVACDLHPDYSSSRYAIETGLPLISVQHHHAHIASVLAETGYTEQVIGVSFDGTGLGDDHAIWGGEFFVCDMATYSRVAHFEYKPMPGGDAAASHPWRMACSYLHSVFGNMFTGFDLPMLRTLPRDQVSLLLQGIDKGLNCPMTSSAGRLFDAAAAITGICPSHSYEAEGPMLLESMIDKQCNEAYPFEFSNGIISFDALIYEMTSDMLAKKPIPQISARFHNAIVECIVKVCSHLADEKGLRVVALSGGVFMNAYLLEHVENELAKQNLTVLSNLRVPSNDAGIALGQMAVAAARK